MPSYQFKQVDAFTSNPLFGNPVAVVLGADGMDEEQMQRIAAWTNLSETTFVLEPTVGQPAYRLRIFTPEHELPFAGHPTIGSCHAVLEAGIVDAAGGRLVQECEAGALPLRIDGDEAQRTIFVEAPPAVAKGEFPERIGAFSVALGCQVTGSSPPAAFQNGPNWLFVRVEDQDTVKTLKPDMQAITRLSHELSISGIGPLPWWMRESSPSTSAASPRPSRSRKTRSREAPTPLWPRTWRATACWSGPAASSWHHRAPSWAATDGSMYGCWTTAAGPRSGARR